MSKIIISDPHGCFDTLQALLKKLPEGRDIVINGDLVDRGSNSRGVVELVREKGWACTLGNHELMMLEALQKRHICADETWKMNGGDITLYNYKNSPEVLKTHLEWMDSLPKYIHYLGVQNAEGRSLFVSHAGLYEEYSSGEHDFTAEELFHEAVRLQCANQEILWHRNRIHDYPGIFQVIGHTPQSNGASLHPHFAKIDTGCYYKRERYGILTALEFPSMKLYTQENIEEEECF